MNCTCASMSRQARVWWTWRSLWALVPELGPLCGLCACVQRERAPLPQTGGGRSVTVVFILVQYSKERNTNGDRFLCVCILRRSALRACACLPADLLDKEDIGADVCGCLGDVMRVAAWVM